MPVNWHWRVIERMDQHHLIFDHKPFAFVCRSVSLFPSFDNRIPMPREKQLNKSGKIQFHSVTKINEKMANTIEIIFQKNARRE